MTASKRPEFYQADYYHAPAYGGWHVRHTTGKDSALLPEQILLHEPLQVDSIEKVQAAAKARNAQRGCLWWAEWKSTPLLNVYHAYESTSVGIHLLVFYQPKSGFTEPFRLLIFPSQKLPKSTKLWSLVADMLDQSSGFSISESYQPTPTTK